VAWERVYSLWFNVNGQDPNHIEDWADANSQTLNQMFFRGEATTASTVHHGGTDEEFQGLISSAYGKSNYAGDFADQLILNPPPDYGHFNHTCGADLWATFTNEVEAFHRFQGGIHAMHIRDGVEWRKSQADCRHVTRIQFLQSLDSQLDSVGSPGDGLADMIKGTYLHGW
jgi:hypothetical protein